MAALKAGALYFALVFGTGFVVGTIRVLWAAPHLGARATELREMPLMLVVTVVAARWTVRRLSVPATWAARGGMEITAGAIRRQRADSASGRALSSDPATTL